MKIKGFNKTELAEKVDRLGTLKAKKKEIEKEEKEIKVILKASGKVRIEGSIFYSLIVASSKSFLDAAGLSEKYGQTWINEWTKISEFNRVDCKPL